MPWDSNQRREELGIGVVCLGLAKPAIGTSILRYPQISSDILSILPDPSSLEPQHPALRFIGQLRLRCFAVLPQAKERPLCQSLPEPSWNPTCKAAKTHPMEQSFRTTRLPPLGSPICLEMRQRKKSTLNLSTCTVSGMGRYSYEF